MTSVFTVPFSTGSFYSFFLSCLVDESMFKWSFIIYYIKEKLLPESHFYSYRQTEIIIFKDLELFLERSHHFILILLTLYLHVSRPEELHSVGSSYKEFLPLSFCIRQQERLSPRGIIGYHSDWLENEWKAQMGHSSHCFPYELSPGDPVSSSRPRWRAIVLLR